MPRAQLQSRIPENQFHRDQNKAVLPKLLPSEFLSETFGKRWATFYCQSFITPFGEKLFTESRAGQIPLGEPKVSYLMLSSALAISLKQALKMYSRSGHLEFCPLASILIYGSHTPGHTGMELLLSSRESSIWGVCLLLRLWLLFFLSSRSLARKCTWRKGQLLPAWRWPNRGFQNLGLESPKGPVRAQSMDKKAICPLSATQVFLHRTYSQ